MAEKYSGYHEFMAEEYDSLMSTATQAKEHAELIKKTTEERQAENIVDYSKLYAGQIAKFNAKKRRAGRNWENEAAKDLSEIGDGFGSKHDWERAEDFRYGLEKSMPRPEAPQGGRPRTKGSSWQTPPVNDPFQGFISTPRVNTGLKLAKGTPDPYRQDKESINLFGQGQQGLMDKRKPISGGAGNMSTNLTLPGLLSGKGTK